MQRGTVTPFPQGAPAGNQPEARPRARSPRASARHHNLPAPLTSFVGREQALADLQGLLATTRLLTLSGAPGIGKTRLALQLAGGGLEAYADGVWLVELASLDEPALVPQAVAAVVGVQEQPGRPLLATLADALRARQMLLVLDNCEHLVAACATLADSLLRAAPELTILATSREALGIAGETTWPLAPLAVPEPPGARHPMEPAALLRSEAVQLFVERARAAQPGFVLGERNATAVGQVCRALDGLPLAVELAAARVRALSVEQLARRLDDQLRLLTGGSRAALPRQQTLRAAVDWSYALLPEPERMLLRRLAVFAGGWTLAMAEDVCAGDGLASADVFTLLVQLVDKSLVVAEPEGDEARYRLLETLRHYGAERLQEAGEEAAVRTRHLEWCAVFADGVEAGLHGPEQAVWIARLDREHDNLRAALAWSQSAPGGTEAGVRLVAGVWPFWYLRSNYSEGRRWLDEALALPGAAAAPAWGTALFGAGAMAQAQGDYGLAEARFEASLARQQERGSQYGAAMALIGLGRLAHLRGSHERAVTLTEESLALFREADAPFGIALALGGLGLVAQAQGDGARAAAYYQEGLAVFQQIGDTHGAAWSFHYLGLVVQARGEHEEAGALYRQGLALRRELEETAGIAGCLEGLAEVAWAQNQPERAARLFEVAATLRDTIGAPLSPHERAEHERTLAAMRARLGETAFAAASAEGRTMPLEQAIDYALATAEPTAAQAGAPARPAASGPPTLLSRREREVAGLLARGLTNREIADALVISEWTVDTHVRHILSKLDFRSRAQVAAWAVEQRLVTPEPR